MARGKFITLEGGEGVGKSTQASRLAEALRARGLDIVVTREPGGTPGAEAIRNLLMTGSEDRWSARAEALLFAAARADHVEKVIRPALERGAWVICDRFLDSTRAYQGGAGGVSDADILALHKVGSDGLMPDRTFLLTVPEAEAADRVRRRVGVEDDRFGNRDSDYHSRLNTAFADFAYTEVQRFRRIDASGSVDGITQKIMSELGDLL
jgi:dTMP kinase